MRIAACVLGAALVAAAAGQSFNIDFDITADVGAGLPSADYDAGAGQPGYWNAVRSTSPAGMTLTDVAGEATSVIFTRPLSGSFVAASHASFNGDWEKLNEDIQLSAPGQSLVYGFSNLLAGTYAVFAYALKPDESLRSNVHVSNSTSTPTQQVGQLWVADGYRPGYTHAIHIVQVPAGGSVNINVMPSEAGGQSAIAGIQLVRMDRPRLRFYLNDDFGTDTTYSGRSWQNHLTSLHTGFEIAELIGPANCELWLARGAYRTSLQADRTRSFALPDGVHVHGGFAGTESALEQRGVPWGTTITGAIGVNGVYEDNAYTIMVAESCGPETLIDGLTFSSAYNDSPDLNWGGVAGAVRLIASSPTFRDCTFILNYAEAAGGAVYSQGGSARFVRCYFLHNSSVSGAAIHHQGGGGVTLINCYASQNDAVRGGVVRILGGSATLANCVLTGNSAAEAGGVVEAIGSSANASALHCTIVGNTAGDCGGMRAISGADLFLYNSIFWFNADESGGPLLAQQYEASGIGSTADVSRTSAQGAAGAEGLDPLFVNAAGPNGTFGDYDDDLSLAAGSPCVDSGDNSLVLPDVADLDGNGITNERHPVDIAGQDRFVDDPATADTGVGTGPLIDRGALERNAPPCDLPGDLEPDGDVDLTDLTVLLANFGLSGGQSRQTGDVNGDGVVDLSDLTVLLAGFGTLCS